MLGSSLLLALLLQQATQAPRTAAIAGQIHTRDGAPVVAMRVAAIAAAPPDARPDDGIQYYQDPPPVAVTLTDARGRFRLPPIPAGRYVIMAGILGKATYYPAATDAMLATVVTVGGTTPTDNLDMTLAQQVGGRVRGTITPAPPAARTQIAVLSGTRLSELIEVPIGADGAFDFGHVPSGPYLMNIFPTPPGAASYTFQVGTTDPAPMRITLPPTHVVTGRLVVENGPLPTTILGFRTTTSYVNATINPDGTFTARLHAATHVVDVGGMPVGYGVRSVRVGASDGTNGVMVGNADVSNVVITIKAPAQLPRLRGRVTGAPPGARVEMTGPIVGNVTTTLGANGAFEFPALVPGLYYLRIPQAPSLGTTNVAVTSQGTSEVEIPRPGAAGR
jgi:hypothetical protein